MKKIKHLYWSWIADNELAHFDIEEYIEILETNNRVMTNLEDVDPIFEKDENFYVFKNNNEYNIYYKDFHIFFDKTVNDRIVTISIKKQDDRWIVPTAKKTVDISHPINESIEVYYNFTTIVKNREQYNGERHLSGTWDKVLVTQIKEFQSKVIDLTSMSLFNKEYGHGVKLFKTYKTSKSETKKFKKTS